MTRIFPALALALLALLPASSARRLQEHGGDGPISAPNAVIPGGDFRKDNAAAGNLTLLNNAPAGSPLVALNPAFWELVDPDAAVEVLAAKNYSFAHEAPVWLPETQQLFFVSNRLTDASGSPVVEQWLLGLDTGELRQLTPDPPILMANGGTPYGKRKVLVTSQDLNDTNGGLWLLDVATQKSKPVVNNWGGLPVNSPNDVAVHGPSGAILFADPAYGFAQGFRPAPLVGNWVWLFHPPTNTTAPVADGFVKPNGVAFSPDFSIAYVTDTGAVDGTGQPASFAAAAPAIYAFDVELDGSGLPTLQRRRLFGVCPSGIPDGIKLDERGNVYVGVPGGVDVFDPTGLTLGSFAVGPTANLALAGDTLVMMQEKKITAVQLRVKGARLPLQAAE
ncbi:hypothetical protein ABPG75_010815 [Micractinium tetrahymenae]